MGWIARLSCCFIAALLFNSIALASNGRLDFIIPEASPAVVALLLNKSMQDVDSIAPGWYDIKDVTMVGRNGKVRLAYKNNRLLVVVWTADSMFYSSDIEKEKDFESYVASLIEIYGEPALNAYKGAHWLWDRGHLSTVFISSQSFFLIWSPKRREE